MNTEIREFIQEVIKTIDLDDELGLDDRQAMEEDLVIKAHSLLKAQLSATKVIIEIRGGVVQKIHADTTEIKTLIVDWDDIEERGPLYGPYSPDSVFESGKSFEILKQNDKVSQRVAEELKLLGF